MAWHFLLVLVLVLTCEDWVWVVAARHALVFIVVLPPPSPPGVSVIVTFVFWICFLESLLHVVLLHYTSIKQNKTLSSFLIDIQGIVVGGTGIGERRQGAFEWKLAIPEVHACG